ARSSDRRCADELRAVPGGTPIGSGGVSEQNPSGSAGDRREPTRSDASPGTDSVGRNPAPQRPAPRRRGRRKLLGALLLGGVLLLAVAGFFLWRYLGTYESTDDAQVDAHLYPVSARVSGYVINVNADDNEYVKAGTVLVEIDPKDYQVALDKARADLASAEA